METITIPTKSRLSEVALDTPLEDLVNDLEAVRRAIFQFRSHEALLELAIKIKQERDGAESPAFAPQGVDAPGIPPAKGLDRRTAGRPGSLREAILWVLKDAARPWSAAEIFEALEAKGWQPTNENARSQVAARLSKMVQRGDVLRLGRGQYALPTVETAIAASKFGDAQ